MKIGDKFLIVSDDHGNIGRIVEVWEILNDTFKPRIVGNKYREYYHYGEYCKESLEDIIVSGDKLAPNCQAIKILFGV